MQTSKSSISNEPKLDHKELLEELLKAVHRDSGQYTLLAGYRTSVDEALHELVKMRRKLTDLLFRPGRRKWAKKNMGMVILESPYRNVDAKEQEINIRYLQACIRDCLKHGEAPFASHQMYTSALKDAVFLDRELGIDAGFQWHFAAEKMVVYEDRGISEGMTRGISHATWLTIPVVHRKLGGEWKQKTSG